MAFYKINGKPYVKAGSRYTEVTAKRNPENKIIFVPTKNVLSIGDVGRDYTLISSEELALEFSENEIKEQKKKKQEIKNDETSEIIVEENEEPEE